MLIFNAFIHTKKIIILIISVVIDVEMLISGNIIDLISC